MKPYTIEELNLVADAVSEAVKKHLEPETHFFLLLIGPEKCGACATVPPEMAEEIQAAMAELSQRKPQFNN